MDVDDLRLLFQEGMDRIGPGFRVYAEFTIDLLLYRVVVTREGVCVPRTGILLRSGLYLEPSLVRGEGVLTPVWVDVRCRHVEDGLMHWADRIPDRRLQRRLDRARARTTGRPAKRRGMGRYERRRERCR